MQRLERSLHVVAEGRGKPVEQLGMRGRCAHAAEIVGGIADAVAEVVVPNTIGHRAPDERIARVHQPFRQCSAAFTFAARLGETEARWQQRVERRQRGRLDDLAGLRDLASGKNADFPRFPALCARSSERARASVDGGRVDRHRRRQRGERLVGACDVGFDLGSSRSDRVGLELLTQLIALGAQLCGALRRCDQRGINAVGQVYSPPTIGQFDAVKTGDGGALRDVASSGIDDLQFSERKDEITLAVRERGCANAHIARHHALRVERHQRGGVRAAGVASCRRDQLHLRLKLGIVGRLDAKLFGETESSADSVEGVAAGREHDLIERARRTEIDLHPLLRVRIEGNLAVISVLGRVLLGRILLGRRAWHSSCEFRRCRGNLAIELHQRVAGGVGKCSIERL